MEEATETNTSALVQTTFEQVLKENKERIFRICRIYAVTPIEPQDLFQEVVYQIWKSFSKFDNRSSISTWVYRIALNVCYSAKMKLNKANVKMVKLDSIRFYHQQSPEDDQLQESYRALRLCIERLDESDKSIVILYLEELPYKQIASVTGLTENHIAVKMKRIKKKLFDCITQKLD